MPATQEFFKDISKAFIEYSRNLLTDSYLPRMDQAVV